MDIENLIVVIIAGKDADNSIFGGEKDRPSKFFMDFYESWVGDMILHAADSIDCSSIYVVGPLEYQKEFSFTPKHEIHMVEQGTERLENMDRALNLAQQVGQYKEGAHILLMMGDLPLLDKESIEEYLLACQMHDEIDAYIGLIPIQNLDPKLTPHYKQDFISMPERGKTYLHSDIYLIRPDKLTIKGKKRFEQVMSIRRLDWRKPSDWKKMAAVIIDIAGYEGIKVFAKIVGTFGADSIGMEKIARMFSRGLEQHVMDIVEEKFGPKIGFVEIYSANSGYEFDSPEQLQVLQEYVKNN